MNNLYQKHIYNTEKKSKNNKSNNNQQNQKQTDQTTKKKRKTKQQKHTIFQFLSFPVTNLIDSAQTGCLGTFINDLTTAHTGRNYFITTASVQCLMVS